MSKILLIDDSKTIQKVAGLILKGSPYSLISAENRQKGEELALKEKPDMALVDLTIGEANGLDLIKFFKNTPSLKTMKIALLFSHLKKEEEEEIKALGIDGKLSKPFNSKEFLSLLLDVLEKKKSLPEPSLVIDMPKDEFKSLFDEEELEKSLEFLEKPIAEVLKPASIPEVPATLQAAPRETIEKVCREIIPPIAEKIIREEIQKLLKEQD